MTCEQGGRGGTSTCKDMSINRGICFGNTETKGRYP